ncbi:MAG: VOC family protein [Spirochaetes bacterium]|nr:VOC family protein [Spirochaetota bacterium]
MDNHANSPFSKLVHLGLIIKDLDKTIDKLSSYGLGPFEYREIPPGAEEWYKDKPLKASFKIAGVNLGGLDLELIQPVDGDSPHMEFLKNHGEGIQHVGFLVDDVDKEVEAMKEKGAKVQLRADLPPKMKVAYMDLDTSGLVCELMQLKE